MYEKNSGYIKPFYTDEMKERIYNGIAEQVILSDIGLSSAAIVDRFKNCEHSKRRSYPRDSSDFGRCYRMIKETGISIDCMLGVSEEWDNIVCMWEPLCKAFLKNDGSFYKLLKEITNIGKSVALNNKMR